MGWGGLGLGFGLFGVCSFGGRGFDACKYELGGGYGNQDW